MAAVFAIRQIRLATCVQGAKHGKYSDTVSHAGVVAGRTREKGLTVDVLPSSATGFFALKPLPQEAEYLPGKSGHQRNKSKSNADPVTQRPGRVCTNGCGNHPRARKFLFSPLTLFPY